MYICVFVFMLKCMFMRALLLGKKKRAFNIQVGGKAKETTKAHWRAVSFVHVSPSCTANTSV